MKSALIFFLLLINISCFSQDTANLVPNWSFEEKDACPSNGLYDPFVKLWFNPTNNTPNYFDSCATMPQLDVPHNFTNGYQYAKNGWAYSGIVLIGNTDEREYISIKLKNTLLEGQKYCFELFYSLSNISCNCAPNLHALFSSDSIYQNNINYIDRQPQIINSNSIIDDTLDWQMMNGEFIANGDEVYLTIGNFFNDANSQEILFDTNFNSCTYGGVYYYIDAVRLYDCTEPDTTVYNTSFFPNPNKGSFTVNYNLGEKTGGSFKIYNAIGQLVYDERLTQNNGTLNLSLLLAEGVYLWEMSDNENKLLRSDKMVVVY